MNQYIDDTCEVTSENSGKTVIADILGFREHEYLSVSLNKSVRVNLQWNGRIYEGKMSGMSFVSTGPKIKNIKTSR